MTFDFKCRLQGRVLTFKRALRGFFSPTQVNLPTLTCSINPSYYWWEFPTLLIESDQSAQLTNKSRLFRFQNVSLLFISKPDRLLYIYETLCWNYGSDCCISSYSIFQWTKKDYFTWHFYKMYLNKCKVRKTRQIDISERIKHACLRCLYFVKMNNFDLSW